MGVCKQRGGDEVLCCLKVHAAPTATTYVPSNGHEGLQHAAGIKQPTTACNEHTTVIEQHT